MLLQSIPNPDYMNGTAAMNSRFGLNSADSKDCGCNDHYDCGCGGNYKMSVQDCGCGGHGGLDCGCGGYYTMVGTHHGMGYGRVYGYGYQHDHDCGCDDDHDCGCGGHHGTMLGSQRTPNSECGCGAMGGVNCSCNGGMGTTGSLGVSLAAPLTRGGFPGEIFDDAPMPSGNWRDAPTPVMLGTAAEDAEYTFLYFQEQNPTATFFDYAAQTWLDANPNASQQKVEAFEAAYGAFVSEFDIDGRYATTAFEYPRDKLLFILEYVEALTDALDNTYGVGGGGTSAYVGGTTLVNDPTGAFVDNTEDLVDPYAQRTTSTGAGKALLLGAVGIGLIGFFDLY